MRGIGQFLTSAATWTLSILSAGGATAPEPRPDRRPIEEVDGESIAVPAGDLTGAVSHAIEEATEHNDEG